MSCSKTGITRIVNAIAAGALGMAFLQPAVADDDAKAAARAAWVVSMVQNPASEAGCHHAAYPSLVWERTECLPPREPLVRPSPPQANAGARLVGDGHDEVVQGNGPITKSVGSFVSVKGVTGETSEGGISGPNEYTLQVNTNFFGKTAVCNVRGHDDCFVWQQFVYATDYQNAGEAAVFMQYWLIEWGEPPCPRGWMFDGGGDCFKNSPLATAPDMPIKSLANLTLSGSAVAGGNDTATFTNGTDVYSVSAPDSQVDISSVWTQSEFNIFGDAGGAEALFNRGSALTVKVAIADGTPSAPTCVASEGTTAETNDLSLIGQCKGHPSVSPFITFTEAN